MVTPRSTGSHSGSGSLGKLGLLKSAGSGVAAQSLFVAKSSKAVRERKLNSTIASFLPTSLMHQLRDAVLDESQNPRLPSERPGIYLCLTFGSLHSLPQLPMEPGQFEAQLRHVFSTIADAVHAKGGELLRMTADSALCLWPLPFPIDGDVRTPGSPVTNAASFDQRRLREAVTQASSCALELLEELNEFVLWADQSLTAHSPARTQQRRAQLVTDSAPPKEPSPSSSTASPEPTPQRTALPTDTPKRSLWGRANKSLASNAAVVPGGKKGAAAGLGFLGAVQAASKVAQTGKGAEVLMSLGAALTVSLAQAIHVGGNHDRWEYLVVAPEIATAHHVLTQVDMGELLISESLWSVYPPASLQQHVQIDEWKRLPQGTALPEPIRMQDTSQQPEERMELMRMLPLLTMKSYVPGPIWAKILAGDPQWIVEQSVHRTLTLLMIRIKVPRDAPLLTQCAAISAAIGIVQLALYKHVGTMKHIVQDSEGCTVTACLGLPPFEHKEVSCSRGAVAIALEVRHQLAGLGLNAHAVALSGKAWIGSVGSETRREYAVVGEPLQLASQMLGFTTDDYPILVDVITSQCNKLKYNFAALSVSIRSPGQLKQHAMLALNERREDLIEDNNGRFGHVEVKPQPVSYDIAQWLRSHNKQHTAKVATNFVAGELSDTALQQMKECFKELDQDRSGAISVEELMEAIREVDTAEEGTAGSLLHTCSKMIKDMDQDKDGTITFDEFQSMASNAFDKVDDASNQKSTTHNLPLLLTAHATRKLLQRRLGESFVESYHKNQKRQSVFDLNRRRSEMLGQGEHIMIAGDDEIDLEYFTDLTKFAEPDRSYTETALKKKFDSFVTDGSGTIDRRDYVRTIMFERLCKGSTRVVELFLRMDTDRSGRVSPDEWRRGLRSMKLSPTQGFTDSDADALFAALDVDDSKEIDYNDLATTLALSKTRQAALERLRNKGAVPLNRRASAMMSQRRTSMMSSTGGMVGGLPPAGKKWTRRHRRASIVGVLQSAEVTANKQLAAVDRPNMGEKAATMQRVVNEVDAIYAQYRQHRNKLGPSPSPASDRSGYLSALLSPRIQIPANYGGETAHKSPTPKASRSPSPPTRPFYANSPLSPVSFHSPWARLFEDRETNFEEPNVEDAECESPDPLSPGLSDAVGSPTTPRRVADTSPMFALTESAFSPRQRLPVAPRLVQSEVVAGNVADKLPNLFTQIPGTPRGRFPGPPAAPRPVGGPPTPRRARAAAPPSSQLPLVQPAAKAPSRDPTPGTDSSRKAAFAKRWDEGQDKDKEAAKALRRGRSRDHHAHVSLSAREPSAWQRELRRRQRASLLDAKTHLETHAEQTARLKAFLIHRDAIQSDEAAKMGEELELGGFAHVGMGIGSRPTTPAEERAMRAWVGEQGISADDIRALKEAEKAADRASKINELSYDEQRQWLSEPVKRASFAPIADILEHHGRLEEFRLAGAPGLVDPNLDGMMEDEDHTIRRIAEEGTPSFSSRSPPDSGRSRSRSPTRTSGNLKTAGTAVIAVSRLAGGLKMKRLSGSSSKSP